MNAQVVVVIGPGQIGQAIARHGRMVVRRTRSAMSSTQALQLVRHEGFARIDSFTSFWLSTLSR